jgi:hypothetical protein
MKMSDLTVINEPNLSVAWARVFLLLTARSNAELAPLVVAVTGIGDGGPVEDKAVRMALDTCLEANKLQSVHTVANTIFPESLWLQAEGNRELFYATYLENLPSYVEMSRDKNKRGLYFARLIAFHTDPKTGERISYVPRNIEAANGNQIEFIIQNCRSKTRRSMFQASIFDPLRDHTRSAQLGFPCLQHVSFVPDFRAKTLMLNAFYATQQAFERAYGNFLGLYRLGTFVAREAGLSFTRMTCFVGIEKINDPPRHDEPTWMALKIAAQRLITDADSETMS